MGRDTDATARGPTKAAKTRRGREQRRPAATRRATDHPRRHAQGLEGDDAMHANAHENIIVGGDGDDHLVTDGPNYMVAGGGDGDVCKDLSGFNSGDLWGCDVCFVAGEEQDCVTRVPFPKKPSTELEKSLCMQGKGEWSGVGDVCPQPSGQRRVASTSRTSRRRRGPSTPWTQRRDNVAAADVLPSHRRHMLHRLYSRRRPRELPQLLRSIEATEPRVDVDATRMGRPRTPAPQRMHL